MSPNVYSEWSTSLKPLDDVMLMREPRSASVPPRRSLLPAGSGLRRLPIDPALDDLLSEFHELRLSPSKAYLSKY